MRHSPARDHRDAFRPGGNHFGDGFPKLLASPRGRQRRQIGVHENRDDRDFPVFDDPFIHSRECMSEDSVLRIRHVEVFIHQFVEQVLSKSLVNREIVRLAGKFRAGPLARHDCEGRDGAQKKRFHVVVANHDGHIRLGLVQVLAQKAHGRDVRVKLSEVFTRRPDKKLWCVYRSECRYDFPHIRILIFVRRRVGDCRSFLLH